MGEDTSPGPRARTRRWWLAAMVAVLLAGGSWLAASALGGSPDSEASSSSAGSPATQLPGEASDQVPAEAPMTFPEKTPGQTVPDVAPAAPPAPAPVTAALTEEAELASDLTVKVVKVESVEGVGRGPGEISGPALRFSIEISNSTGKRIDLGRTVVNAYYGSDSSPASPLSEPGGTPFPATLADGDSAVGVFVFSVPADQRDQVKVEFSYSVTTPTVIFEGSAAS